MDGDIPGYIRQRLISALAADRDLAIEYLHTAIESEDITQIELAVRDVEEAGSMTRGLSH